MTENNPHHEELGTYEVKTTKITKEQIIIFLMLALPSICSVIFPAVQK